MPLIRVRASSLPGLLCSVSVVGLCPLDENYATQARRSLENETKPLNQGLGFILSHSCFADSALL